MWPLPPPPTLAAGLPPPLPRRGRCRRYRPACRPPRPRRRRPPRRQGVDIDKIVNFTVLTLGAQAGGMGCRARPPSRCVCRRRGATPPLRPSLSGMHGVFLSPPTLDPPPMSSSANPLPRWGTSTSPALPRRPKHTPRRAPTCRAAASASASAKSGGCLPPPPHPLRHHRIVGADNGRERRRHIYNPNDLHRQAEARAARQRRRDGGNGARGIDAAAGDAFGATGTAAGAAHARAAGGGSEHRHRPLDGVHEGDERGGA